MTAQAAAALADSRPAPGAPRTGARPADTQGPATRAIVLTLAGFVGAVLLNLHHILIWTAVFALALVVWRARRLVGPMPLPGRTLRYGLAVALTVGVALAFRTLNGLQAGASLLTGMTAIKLLETRGTRDWLTLVAGSIFLLLAACLDAQSLLRLPLYAAELWLVCSGAYALCARGSRATTAALFRRSARGLLAAVPLALVLFLFVPRLPGALWTLPAPNVAVTGLGNTMSPGSISRLIESDDPALRVQFDGPLPPPAARYWRGPVLHEFDGYTWRRLGGRFPRRPSTMQFFGHAYRYRVTLAPNRLHELIGMDLPLGPPSSPTSFETFDYQLITRRPMQRTFSYRLISFPAHRDPAPLSAAARQLDLQLPPGRNPRTLALAARLRARSATDFDYVRAVLNYFRHGSFRYTLTPPRLGANSVDDLLFKTRAGFCSHYASAFAMLMRAGGVPAHIVTGYLGGDWNRFGHYLTIRESDAHAWDEVWLPGRGWTRVDPTAVIDPQSLTQPIDQLLPAAATLDSRLRGLPLIGSALQMWGAMNYWWQSDVLEFDQDKQRSLLHWLGFRGDEWQAMAGLLALGAAAWLLWIGVALRSRPPRARRDVLSRSWLALERKLARSAAPRAPYEGALAYAERIGRLRPALAPSLRRLARRYASLRYGRSCAARELLRFQQEVRAFDPRRAQRPASPSR